MPDPDRLTISATEMPILYGESPYGTPWLLHQRFAKGLDIDSEGNDRTRWGLLMQPLILAEAAREYALEVRPNPVGFDGRETYFRRGLLGCTRDGIIVCPERGPGAIETKCCFDFQVWMREYNGGRHLPRRHEIQNQVQMKVGEGEGSPPFAWGLICVWVGAGVHYFERKPIPKLWDSMELEAEIFFNNVRSGQEPDPLGQPIEIPWLKQVFPIVPAKEVDFRARPNEVALAQIVRMFEWARTEKAGFDKLIEAHRAEVLALMRDAETGYFYGGIIVTRRVDTRGAERLKVYIPDALPDDLMEAVKNASVAG